MSLRDDISVPLRIAALPRDARGYFIPWFVHCERGIPDFRVVGAGKVERAVAGQRCWICGDRLGRNLAFVLGPMCTINRVSAEPPAHRECANYAVQVCPFLARPKMHRQKHNMLPDAVAAPGIMLERNPGVAAVWMTREFRLRAAHAGERGVLFRVGEPIDVVWWREGRRATKGEVSSAIVAGLPALADLAAKEGARAVDALKWATHQALRWLPDEDDDAAGVGEEAASPYEPGTAVAEVTIVTR